MTTAECRAPAGGCGGLPRFPWRPQPAPQACARCRGRQVWLPLLRSG